MSAAVTVLALLAFHLPPGTRGPGRVAIPPRASVLATTSAAVHVTEQVKELRSEGLKYREIAERTGLTIQQAFRIMRNAGLSTPQKSRVMQHDDKLVELRRSGLTYIAIGGMLNMSHSNVRHRLRRLNATAKAKPFTEEETETLLDVYAHTGSWEGVHDHVVAMGKKHPRQRVENILRKQGATQRRKRHIDGEMVRLLETGEATSLQDIARLMGLSQGCVLQRSKMLGVSGKRRRPQKNPLLRSRCPQETEAAYDQINDARAAIDDAIDAALLSGEAQALIASRYGCSQPYVSKRLRCGSLQGGEHDAHIRRALAAGTSKQTIARQVNMTPPAFSRHVFLAGLEMGEEELRRRRELFGEFWGGGNRRHRNGRYK
tara:strand:+ start:122 stop:1243 length:1122 start_codon:yes stop_codon:yes gene_type:complete